MTRGRETGEERMIADTGECPAPRRPWSGGGKNPERLEDLRRGGSWAAHLVHPGRLQSKKKLPPATHWVVWHRDPRKVDLMPALEQFQCWQQGFSHRTKKGMDVSWRPETPERPRGWQIWYAEATRPWPDGNEDVHTEATMQTGHAPGLHRSHKPLPHSPSPKNWKSPQEREERGKYWTGWILLGISEFYIWNGKITFCHQVEWKFGEN